LGVQGLKILIYFLKNEMAKPGKREENVTVEGTTPGKKRVKCLEFVLGKCVPRGEKKWGGLRGTGDS